jgi:membrane fusion protein (multidrug efflux system)
MFKSRIAASAAVLLLVGLAIYSQRPPRTARQMSKLIDEQLQNEMSRLPSASLRATEEVKRLSAAHVDMTPTGSITSGASVATADSISDGNSVRVVVHANQHVTIGSELNARVVKMAFKDGQRFKKGDALVAFDCARTEAELASAKAVFNGHKTAYESNRQMLRYKAIGALTVNQSKFEMEKAAADVQNLEAKKGTCVVFAPFSGRVVESLAHTYEIVAPNQPLLKIVDESKPELDLMTPSHWLGWIKPGVAFEVQLDDTGEKYRAVVSRIGGAVDPVSQTVRMTADIEAPDESILSGMSGTAIFPRGEKK